MFMALLCLQAKSRKAQGVGRVQGARRKWGGRCCAARGMLGRRSGDARTSPQCLPFWALQGQRKSSTSPISPPIRPAPAVRNHRRAGKRGGWAEFALCKGPAEGGSWLPGAGSDGVMFEASDQQRVANQPDGQTFDFEAFIRFDDDGFELGVFRQ